MVAVVPANRENSHVVNASLLHQKTEAFIRVPLLDSALRQNRAIHCDLPESVREILGIRCTFPCLGLEEFSDVSALEIQSRFDLRFQNEGRDARTNLPASFGSIARLRQAFREIHHRGDGGCIGGLRIVEERKKDITNGHGEFSLSHMMQGGRKLS